MLFSKEQAVRFCKKFARFHRLFFPMHGKAVHGYA
ncbi:hypothetical protein CGSHi22121_03200 [Haemophilus influenzae 22.1-21]|uniref:Uncharacterized protein n=1 Tax=Haemophilus influenzae (strain PittGG) TaxID=374931 RepID=A5UIH0_HAEIG|nr:hypothetical protein CGSHiGG_08820 [Haemophilus influenzae PittGG]EDJ89445.1 hypothetical protein CGSHi22121_03200 [Haemophilus influenzae 22.1-21]